MTMIDKVAQDIIDYMTQVPELDRAFDYLARYKFKGFSRYSGKHFIDVIAELGGWEGFCKDEIFIDGVQTIIMNNFDYVDQLARYAIQRMTYLVAMDMLVEKFREQRIYEDNEVMVRFITGDHSINDNLVRLILEINYNKRTQDPAEINIYVKPKRDGYKVEDSALDQKLMVGITQSSQQAAGWRWCQLKDMNKAGLEALLRNTNWIK